MQVWIWGSGFSGQWGVLLAVLQACVFVPSLFTVRMWAHRCICSLVSTVSRWKWGCQQAGSPLPSDLAAHRRSCRSTLNGTRGQDRKRRVGIKTTAPAVGVMLSASGEGPLWLSWLSPSRGLADPTHLPRGGGRLRVWQGHSTKMEVNSTHPSSLCPSPHCHSYAKRLKLEIWREEMHLLSPWRVLGHVRE